MSIGLFYWDTRCHNPEHGGVCDYDHRRENRKVRLMITCSNTGTLQRNPFRGHFYLCLSTERLFFKAAPPTHPPSHPHTHARTHRMIFNNEIATYQWRVLDVILNNVVLHTACLFEVIVELHEPCKFDQFGC
jgi:hypothetical protein